MSREVLDLIEKRTSTRVFSEKEVTDEQRAAVLRAASRAPSAGAMMLYSIIDIREQATLERLAVLCDNQKFIAKAPWALVFVADYCKWVDQFAAAGCFEADGPRAPGAGEMLLACEDAIIAAQNAVVAAEAVGLGSCYIGDIMENASEVAELLGLPAHTYPAAMLVLGEPAYPRPQTPHPCENLVMSERYRRATPDVVERQLAERGGTIERKAPGDRARGLYKRKYAAGFTREMNRSAEEWLLRWKGELP